MGKIRVLELFCGTKSIGKYCARFPELFEVTSVDIEKKWDPDIIADVNTWDYKSLRKKFDIIHGSPPCQEFSVLRLKTDVRDIPAGNNLVKKTLAIIEHFKPKVWILENPKTGKLVHQPYMKDLPFFDVTYCSYGFLYLKPTRLWTNLKSFTPKYCDPQKCHAVKNGHHVQTIGFAHEYPRCTYQTRVPPDDRLRLPPKLVKSLFESALHDMGYDPPKKKTDTTETLRRRKPVKAVLKPKPKI